MDLLHAVEHLQQRGVELPRSADGAEHGAQGPGGSVDVEAHLDQFGDDRLNLRVAGALLHDDNHG